MGFRLPERTVTFRFEDGPYIGLEAKMRLHATLEEIFDLKTLTQGDRRKEYAHFAGKLISWNMENEQGLPVPATIDGVWKQDYALIQFLIDEWYKAVVMPPVPLAETSDVGSTSEEELTVAAPV